MTVHVFGDCDGIVVEEITIVSAAGARARIITWGAVLRDLQVPSKDGLQRVVLGLNALADYRNHSSHMGAIAGRFANRIAHGTFTLDGVTHHLPLNQAGKHSLHGGGAGFGVRPWRLRSHSANRVTLGLRSLDGDAGYPGTMDVTCTYTLLEPATLQVHLTATCDAPTIINLAHHSYFNLDGAPDILGHELMIPSQFRTPTDAELIPTGEIRDVSGTPWDFRSFRAIGESGVNYDANYIIDAAPDSQGLAFAARVRSQKSLLQLDVHTTAPCVQFYDAANLNLAACGHDGKQYGTHAGFCLEPQTAPDAPNRRHFPNAVLRPDQEYRQITEYRFG